MMAIQHVWMLSDEGISENHLLLIDSVPNSSVQDDFWLHLQRYLHADFRYLRRRAVVMSGYTASALPFFSHSMPLILSGHF
jgi:hypothetical protein